MLTSNSRRISPKVAARSCDMWSLYFLFYFIFLLIFDISYICNIYRINALISLIFFFMSMLSTSIYNLLDFREFDKLINRFIGNSGLIINIFIINHLIHIIRANGSNNILLFLIIPNFLILIKFSFIQLIE